MNLASALVPLSCPVRRSAGPILAGALVVLSAALSLRAQDVSTTTAPVEPIATAPADVIPDAPTTAPAGRVLTLDPKLLEIPGVRPNITVRELEELGDKLMNGDTAAGLEDAVLIFGALVRKSPRDASYLTRLGFAYERLVATAQAESAPEDRIKSLKDQAVEAYLRAAPILFEAGNLEAAEDRYLKRVLRYQPKNPAGLLGLARVYAAGERNLEASERFREYLSSPQGKVDYRAHVELGRVYRRLNYINQSLDVLKKAMKGDSFDPEALYELALTYLAAGRPQDAIASADKALELAAARSDEHRYHDLCAQVRIYASTREVPKSVVEQRLARAGQEIATAIAQARALLSARPDDLYLLRDLGNYLKTQESMIRAQIRGDQDVENLVAFARNIREQSEIAQTLKLHEALKVLPLATGPLAANVSLLETRAELLRAVYRLDDAATTCQRLLEVDPNNAVGRRVMREVEELRASFGGSASVAGN